MTSLLITLDLMEISLSDFFIYKHIRIRPRKIYKKFRPNYPCQFLRMLRTKCFQIVSIIMSGIIWNFFFSEQLDINFMKIWPTSVNFFFFSEQLDINFMKIWPTSVELLHIELGIPSNFPKFKDIMKKFGRVPSSKILQVVFLIQNEHSYRKLL